MANSNKAKKSISFNPFIMLFLVIILVYIANFLIAPGAFEREMVDGRNQVIAGSFHTTERVALSLFDIFRAVPNGLIGSASIVFLVLIVEGSIEIFNKTGAIPSGITRLVKSAGKKSGTLVLTILFSIFAILGGFLGWIEACIPFVPLIIPVVLALGYDTMTAVAVVILGSMVGFAIGPTNTYTVGIAHQIAELPMFSGFQLRFICYLAFCAVSLIYLIVYANKSRKDTSKSLVAGIDVSDLRFDYDAAGFN